MPFHTAKSYLKKVMGREMQAYIAREKISGADRFPDKKCLKMEYE